MKNTQFTIELVYNSNGNDKEYFRNEYTYHKRKNISYKDLITFTESKIIITGKRSKQSALNLTMDSSLYKELWKCCIFAYLSHGVPFKDIKLIASYGKNINIDIGFEKLDFQYYSKHLDPSLLIKQDQLKILFDYTYGDKLLISFTEFILGLNSSCEEINDYWKAFDSFYKVTTFEARDSEALKKINQEIVKSFTDKSIPCEYILAHEDIVNSKIDIYYYFSHKRLPKAKKINHLKSIKTKYNDKILNQKIDYFLSEKFDIKEQAKSTVDNNLVKRLSFLVTDYIYLKRCGYFHGGEASPTFMLKGNNRIEENKIFNELIKLTLVELYNNTTLISNLLNQ